jgi:hypothetical protein
MVLAEITARKTSFIFTMKLMKDLKKYGVDFMRDIDSL